MSARANAIRPYEKNEKDWIPDQVSKLVHSRFQKTKHQLCLAGLLNIAVKKVHDRKVCSPAAVTF
jgi:hypothetical protein